jgi:hypothetical protein
MKTKRGKITIALEEQVIRWACAEALRKRISISDLLTAISKGTDSRKNWLPEGDGASSSEQTVLQFKNRYLPCSDAHLRGRSS